MRDTQYLIGLSIFVVCTIEGSAESLFGEALFEYMLAKKLNKNNKIYDLREVCWTQKLA